ncbi:MAG: hypothetical protein JRH13_03095 [Deltaproteobacteria bacterium]|nr:hypothetical protein [Deltaproteobacteria bacterium]MBW2128333.1 hypothetical protein [Deltaproteobacteria bacterium]
MNAEKSMEPDHIFAELEKEFRKAALHRPMRVERYEPGTVCTYEVSIVPGGSMGRVRLEIDRFVGGGFAGQVYRVKILQLEPHDGPLVGLEKDRYYAMKILVPPTGFSRFFRNTLYWVGFQGPFQLQVNPHAARAGALWQIFIRRGARLRFGDDRTVADIHATFVDPVLGSCGELSEWIEGRTWRLEVDDRLDLLRKWRKGRAVHEKRLGSPEYRAKHAFMHAFVRLLHDMGAHEFARQYEWSTWKSQPNVLKRLESDPDPAEGLVAVDFRAGLVLLPFLPMSPGDFKLILQGLRRGSLVQFDRGDISRLEGFVEKQREAFSDLYAALKELKEEERTYRRSIPDITHHHLRLLYKGEIWSGILRSAVMGWRVRNFIDEEHARRLQEKPFFTLFFCILNLFPLLGRILLKWWGHPAWRRHYTGILGSVSYLRRAFRGKLVEKVMGWYRSGRMDADHALKAARTFWPNLYHFPLSILPAGLHRAFTDWQYAKERIDHLVFRPVRLYFNAHLREQWLRDMVSEGEENNLLSREDADLIISQIKEPFIQKYLKSLAVHLCTLPVTQVVSILTAAIYVLMHPELPRAQAYAVGVGIIALFQVVPISPGSLVRGLYVVLLVIRERNFKDYNIAVFLGFFKYVGYLAFPIQMAYRYPALARFMAGYWATEAVHAVPVFGERGALLEHKVFNLFYNWPLTIRRKIRSRERMRSAASPRYWHIAPCALIGAAILGFVDYRYFLEWSRLPALQEIWWAVGIVPILCGMAVTLGAGGAPLGKRVAGGTLCGAMLGIFSTVSGFFVGTAGGNVGAGTIVSHALWRMFLFGILSTVGVLLMEITLPDPGESRIGEEDESSSSRHGGKP